MTKLFFLLFISLSFSLSLVGPFNMNIEQNSTIDIGEVGPGQTFYISVDPEVKTGGINGIGGRYDVLTAEVPSNFKVFDSQLYQNPMQIEITTDPHANQTRYTIRVIAIDEGNGEGLGNFSFFVTFKIKNDLVSLEIPEPEKTIGVKQFAPYTIKITNKGRANDVFVVSITGIKGQELEKKIYIPAYQTKEIHYEISGQEEETYVAKVCVRSISSPKIHQCSNIKAIVKTDPFTDMLAINNGVLLSPIILQQFYSLFGFVSNLFSG